MEFVDQLTAYAASLRTVARITGVGLPERSPCNRARFLRLAIGMSSRCAAPALRSGPWGHPPPPMRRSAALA